MFESDGSNITVGGPDNAGNLSYSSSGNLISGEMETPPADGDVVYIFEGQQYNDNDGRRWSLAEVSRGD